MDITWECEEYDHRDMEHILPEEVGDGIAERMSWTFSRERNSRERLIMNNCFKLICGKSEKRN